MRHVSRFTRRLFLMADLLCAIVHVHAPPLVSLLGLFCLVPYVYSVLSDTVYVDKKANLYYEAQPGKKNILVQRIGAGKKGCFQQTHPVMKGGRVCEEKEVKKDVGERQDPNNQKPRTGGQTGGTEQKQHAMCDEFLACPCVFVVSPFLFFRAWASQIVANCGTGRAVPCADAWFFYDFFCSLFDVCLFTSSLSISSSRPSPCLNLVEPAGSCCTYDVCMYLHPLPADAHEIWPAIPSLPFFTCTRQCLYWFFFRLKKRRRMGKRHEDGPPCSPRSTFNSRCTRGRKKEKKRKERNDVGCRKARCKEPVRNREQDKTLDSCT